MNPSGMYKQSATIKSPAQAQAADGSMSWLFSSSDPVSCEIQPLSSSESIQLDRQASGEFARMYCGADVSVNDKCEVLDSAGVTWRVVGHPRNTGGRGVFLTIDLERMK